MLQISANIINFGYMFSFTTLNLFVGMGTLTHHQTWPQVHINRMMRSIKHSNQWDSGVYAMKIKTKTNTKT